MIRYRFPLPRPLPLLPTLLAALLLSACGGQDAGEPAQRDAEATRQAAAQQAQRNLPSVTGRVSAGDLTQLPRGVVLQLRLLDVTDPAAPPATVAQATVDTRRLPADFVLPYEPDRIVQDRRYVLQGALVTEGVTLYSTPEPQAVLTQGAASRADLVLERGSGPDTSISVAEQFRRDFDLLESQLGTLRRVVGERITDDVTVGWDAFVDNTGVRFARESVDFAQGGRASFRYAFRYGKPWVVARERGGRTTWVGWDEDGALVLNQAGEGTLPEAEAGRLFERAAEVLEIASGSSGRAR